MLRSTTPKSDVNPAPAPRTDADEAMRFLKALRPDGPWVLTSIIPDGATDTRTFDSEPEARAYIEAHNKSRNLYYTGNPCGRPKKKPGKADVTGAIFLHVDSDPEKGEEPTVAKARIRAAYEAQDPPPSIIIDSGNGLQGLWLLEDEHPIPRPAAGLEGAALKAAVDAGARAIEDRNRVLAAATGAPAGTHNVDRLLRLPGTINYPNKAKREAGRVACQARIISLTDERYPLGLFDEVAPVKGNGADKASNGADHSAESAAAARIELDWAKVVEHEGWLKGVDDLPADFPFKGKLIVGHHGDLAELNDTLSAAGLINVPYESWSDVSLALAAVFKFYDQYPVEKAAAALMCDLPCNQHILKHTDEKLLRRAVERCLVNSHDPEKLVEKSRLTLKAMNEKHAVLPIGGKTRVVTFGELDEFPGRETIVMTQSFGDFAALHDKFRYFYFNKEGELKSKRLGSYWLEYPSRRQYTAGMAFMPKHDEKVVKDKLNLWHGYGVNAVKPAGKSGAAGASRFLEFALDVICSGNEEHYDYLIKREAFILQRRARSEIALGLSTILEGVGKGFYERAMRRLLGNHAMQVDRPEHVIGKFNPHLETLLRLTADEALFAGDMRHRNVLYGLITEQELTIEPKFCGVYTAANYNNISITTNAVHFIVVGENARRFFVPTISLVHEKDFDYFGAITDQLENDGGYEALLYHLLHEVDLRDFEVRKVPRTAGLVDQISYSRRGVDGLVETVCNTARVPNEHPSWPGFSDERRRRRPRLRGHALQVQRPGAVSHVRTHGFEAAM
jgi:hypothetical protein